MIFSVITTQPPIYNAENLELSFENGILLFLSHLFLGGFILMIAWGIVFLICYIWFPKIKEKEMKE